MHVLNTMLRFRHPSCLRLAERANKRERERERDHPIGQGPQRSGKKTPGGAGTHTPHGPAMSFKLTMGMSPF